MALLLALPWPSSSLPVLSPLLNANATLSPKSQAQCSWKDAAKGSRLIFSSNTSLLVFRSDSVARARGFQTRAFFPNPIQEPILRDALKEPVAFVGGMFAGLLRLDLNEEPLKEWVSRTVEASGISAEEISKKGDEDDEDMAQQIEIEIE